MIAESKSLLIKSLIRSLPEGALRSLDMALGMTSEASLAEVGLYVAGEIEARRLREAVFLPYLPLFAERPDGLEGLRFPVWVLESVWAATVEAEPGWHRDACQAAKGLRHDDPTPVSFFHLVNAAALICRESPERVCRGRTDSADRAYVGTFGLYLELHRIIRRLMAQLPELMGRLDAEKTTALKVMFKDSNALNDEGGIAFMETLYANLRDGAQIMRFVGAVSDRSSDRFLAESEMGPFGERVLHGIETSLGDVRRALGGRSKDCDDLGAVCDRIVELMARLQSFEHSLELARNGPWGKRVADVHRIIAELVEGQIKGAERKLEAALPIRTERVYGRVRREIPDLLHRPTDATVKKAADMISFVRRVRVVASAGGFSTLQAKTMEALETQIDSFFEELLGLVNGGEPFDPELIIPFFDIVTDLAQELGGDEKANLLRRRIGASDIGNAERHIVTASVSEAG